MVKDKERENQLAFKAGQYFDNRITSVFWSSFKGEMGRIQAAVLVFLYDHKNCRINDIADELNVPKQHISKIVIGFIRDGLAESGKDETDKRAAVVALTEKGNSLIKEHYEKSSDHFQSLLAGMKPEDRKQFIRALETIERLLRV